MPLDASPATTLTMGRVTLTVHALDRVVAFYEEAVGLHLLRRDAASAELGVGNHVLLELRHDPTARRRSMREAGLFHTAFLLPSRTALANWTREAMRRQRPVVGASDHAVSEAIYLSDPEGNGVEIYADRPRDQWRWENGAVAMTTDALDVEDLLAASDGAPWTGVPEESSVGHVHLQVGALDEAEAFYAGRLGLDVTCRYPGAIFFAADGYHHHLATNIWNSRKAGPRAFPSTGLSELEIHVAPARAAGIGAGGESDTQTPLTLADPWGTRIALLVR
ncbi:VOC family protein [Aureimonas ureilytica]|nr:VOC family protein [Aureimonas ureilytica]